MKKPKSRFNRKQQRLSEVQEIQLLQSWIEFGKPKSGSNPLSAEPLPVNSHIGQIDENTFSRYVGCNKFEELPLSMKTIDALVKAKYTVMTDIQRASLPHSLCGRDILGAAKTGSGKTLAFVIPILEKLYNARWGSEVGVGSIIITPTRELGAQIFDVLKAVGKFHGFSAGLLIGGRKDVGKEKDRVNDINILVCTPGRLLQHMDETPNFDCSQLQVLVLDEADRLLDEGFKKSLNAIISQLPKRRQTLLFSATQTKSVQDLARLSLKDPEYLSVHEDSVTSTPSRLQQTAIEVPLDQKLDMLWSFIRLHLNSKILVFLSTCKQVKFVFEAFKKLRPGIPLKCLHGRIKQEKRMGVYSDFCTEKRAVLFSTDVASRGLDFNKAVDWVVQVDCPEDVDTYIHRVGRTARYDSGGSSILFLMPSEAEVFRKKLELAKVPVHVKKADPRKLESVSGLLAVLLVKFPDMQLLAKRAFITYLKSIHKQKDKEVFDVMELPKEEFSASLGLPMTPKTRFINKKTRAKTVQEESPRQESAIKLNGKTSNQKTGVCKSKKEEDDDEEEEQEEVNEEEEKNMILLPKESEIVGRGDDAIPETRILKKKGLKINIHRPTGTRMVYDDECNMCLPLAAISGLENVNDKLEHDKVQDRYAKHRTEMKLRDKEDKAELHRRLKEKRVKQKIKSKKPMQDGIVEEDFSVSDEESDDRTAKRPKKYFGNVDGEGKNAKLLFTGDSISLAEQEDLALKLLSNMHS